MAEAKLDLSDYQGSCDAEEMKRTLKAEMSENLQWQYNDIATRMALLKSENNSIDPAFVTAERAYLMEKLVPIKMKLAQIDEKIQKNNTLLTKLYNIRESAKNDPDHKNITSSIEFDDKGKPSLKISLDQQMDGAVGFDFSIHDGKVIFGQMTPDKMIEVLDFLYRHGVTNFELPQGAPRNVEDAKKILDEKGPETPKISADEKLEGISPALAEKPADQMTEEEKQQVAAAADREAEQPSSNAIGRDEKAEAEEAAYQAAAGGNTGAAPATPEKPKEKEKDFYDARKELRTWGETTLGKDKGFGMHISWGGMGNTFSFYQDNSQDWEKDDGKHDKKKKRKEDGLLFRVRLHKGKDGKLGGISYYVPKNGKIPDTLAGKMAAMIKSQGALYMNFPEGLPDGDAGVFRKACAQNGVIPTGKGVGINENQARNMIKEAENNLNKSKALKYKGQMGRFLLKQGTEKNDKDLQNYAMTLINEEKLTPLKEFCDTIFPEISKESNDSNAKAQNIIGSAQAVETLYNIFDNNGRETLPELLNSDVLSQEEKKALMNVSVDPNTPIESMDKEALKAIYDALKQQKSKEAEVMLQKEIQGIGNDKDRKERVKEFMGEAQGTLGNVISKFDDNNLRGLRCNINKTTPKFVPSNTNSSSMSNTSSIAAAARQRLAER